MIARMATHKFAAALLAMLLAGCASEIIVPEPVVPERMNPVADRISDEAIAEDRLVIDKLRQRLRTLNDSGRWPMDNYQVCKAQAWIDFAEVEYSDNDRGTVVESALNQARGLIDAMQAGGTNLPVATPVLDESMVVRPDLWELADKARQERKDGCFDCALAKLEVQLVAAGHDQKELGPRHAESGILAAERLARTVSGGSGVCAVPGSTRMTAVMITAIGERDASHGTAEDLRIPVVVHFAYNSALLGDETAKQLTRVAQILREHPQITVHLVGHTDRRGSDGYNQILGQRRARAVQGYLITAGVGVDRISEASKGKHESLQAEAPALKGMAMDRRVELHFENLPDIQTERQALDLQPDR